MLQSCDVDDAMMWNDQNKGALFENSLCASTAATAEGLPCRVSGSAVWRQCPVPRNTEANTHLRFQGQVSELRSCSPTKPDFFSSGFCYCGNTCIP